MLASHSELTFCLLSFTPLATDSLATTFPEPKFPSTWIKNLHGLTAICAELCCQTTWGDIPLLCAKLEPQRSHLRSKQWPKCTQNLGCECMHLIGRQNKHSKFACNTLRILPVTMSCAVLCWQTYLGTYSSAFCHPWALKKAFKKSNKCQR